MPSASTSSPDASSTPPHDSGVLSSGSSNLAAGKSIELSDEDRALLKKVVRDALAHLSSTALPEDATLRTLVDMIDRVEGNEERTPTKFDLVIGKDRPEVTISKLLPALVGLYSGERNFEEVLSRGKDYLNALSKRG